MEADDALGVPCGLLASVVRPTDGVVAQWSRRWVDRDVDPMVGAWAATRSIANLGELLTYMIGSRHRTDPITRPNASIVRSPLWRLRPNRRGAHRGAEGAA